jgi:hypothetical protein
MKKNTAIDLLKGNHRLQFIVLFSMERNFALNLNAVVHVVQKFKE